MSRIEISGGALRTLTAHVPSSPARAAAPSGPLTLPAGEPASVFVQGAAAREEATPWTALGGCFELGATRPGAPDLEALRSRIQDIRSALMPSLTSVCDAVRARARVEMALEDVDPSHPAMAPVRSEVQALSEQIESLMKQAVRAG